MAIVNFLLSYWDSVLVILLLIAGVLFLVKRGETKILENILYSLVTQAEKEFGDGTGSLKYAAVVDWIYQRIPAVLKLIFTEKNLNAMIEDALAKAKEQWAKNNNLQGYIDN